MGEAKRITQDVRDAREAVRQADAVEASRDRMRKAVDGLTGTLRWRMETLTQEEMVSVLGTTVGIYAASAAGSSGADEVLDRVVRVARDVVEQAGETA